MKKTLLMLGSLALTANSVHASAVASQASEAVSTLFDKAIEIVPKAILGTTSYIGSFIEKRPGIALIAAGILAMHAYEQHKTLEKRSERLAALAYGAYDSENANQRTIREQAIQDIQNDNYRITLTLSPLSWIQDIISAFVGLRANR